MVGIATAIGSNVVLGALIPPADFGLYFILASVLTIRDPRGAMFGLNTGLVRFVSESIGVRDLHQVRRVLRQGSLLSAVALVAGAGPVLAFVHFLGQPLFEIPMCAWVAPLLAISVIAWGVIQLCAALLRSFHDSRWSILLTGQFGGPLCNSLFVTLIVTAYILWPPLNLKVAVLASAIALCIVMPLALKALFSVGKRRLMELTDAGPRTESNVLTWAAL